ncbi:hypothetical protein ONZ51_g2875 [Trametes cubensis]|uniref:Uncharacterized protein n=1 Tax=Trametes cubensis TaxID=1111947 RepID=A0AAD7XDJ0_9APHY|nr:hypothetical protein ONZ51_g2875 [Trametes cubensis]
MTSRAASRLGTNPAPRLDPKAAWPIDGQTWLVLEDDTVSVNFPQGTLVLITDHVALPESRSASPTRLGVRTKVNTVYHFKKKHIVYEYTTATTFDGPGGGIISTSLSPTSRGKPNPNALFEPGQLVYAIGDIPPIRCNGQTFEIPYNTVGKILKNASRAGPGKVLASEKRHGIGARYIVQFALKVTKHTYAPSKAARPSNCFRLATPAEIAAQNQGFKENPEGTSLLSKYNN